MKILIYSPYSIKFGGGGERWIIEVAKRLMDRGHDIKIVTTTFGTRELQDTFHTDLKKLKQSVEWIELPYYKLPLGILLLPPKAFRELLKIANSVDIVYFNNIFTLQEVMMLIVKVITKKRVINMYQAPIVYTSFLSRVYRNTISRNVVRYFDANHVLNNHDRQILERWGIKNIYQIPNGVDIEKFRPPAGEKDSSKFTVLFVGRLNYHKGFDILLEAIKIVNQDSNLSSGIHFIIAGSGEMQSKITKLEEEHENIKYLGQVSHEKLPEIYAGGDILIMPSRWEGLPLVGAEAQASGLPVIAADTLGAGDVIKNMETGILIKPNDSQKLVEAINSYYRLWRDKPGEHKQIQQKSRMHAKSKFDWNAITRDIESVLRNITGKRQA